VISTDHSPSPAGECAPVAIFAYKRHEHLNRLIDSLLANESFPRAALFVFCDGARDERDAAAVAQTRRVVRERLGPRAEIIESAANKGLARSIIHGVTELCRRYGQVIVLEDDLVLHPDCLNFMNAALRQYAQDPRVYHVNAYRYPVPAASAPTFSRLASSWGWATWQRAWAGFEPDASELQRRLRECNLIGALDFQGAFPYHRMLEDQAAGRVDSWAIRWYASILLRGGLAVVPNVAQASNHGLDATGVHCSTTSIYDVSVGTASRDWPADVTEDTLMYQQMQAFFRSTRRTFPRRVVGKLKRMLLVD
jgi:hypothetical protein